MGRFFGGCHCGNITYLLEWSGDGDLPLRKCNCTFCVKHGATYFGHERAALSIIVRDPMMLSDYQFGTGTGHFHSCARCVVFICATSVIDGREHAVLNANTLDDFSPSTHIEVRDYEGEDVSKRLTRRRHTWIPNVSITVKS